MQTSALTEMPEPQFVMSSDGFRLATYTWGDAGATTVLAVHGFGSSARDNWVSTGWVRDLLAAGFRVVAVDQRGHAASEKPYGSTSYVMTQLVDDLVTVLDDHLLDEVAYLGYSLGARVGWELAVTHPERVERAVLGGIPDGQPLRRLDTVQARAYIDRGTPVEDPTTQRYVGLAERVRGNDLRALVAIAEGMKADGGDPDPASPPAQPVLFATGGDDPILEQSRQLAGYAPRGEFFEIDGRHHVNAPGARTFRAAGLQFLRSER